MDANGLTDYQSLPKACPWLTERMTDIACAVLFAIGVALAVNA